jgi:hypothetical protein
MEALMTSGRPTAGKPAARPQDANAVDEFMRGLDHPLKPAIEIVRSVILGASSKIAEGIKWNSPSFYVKASELWFATVNINARAGEKDRVLVIFHQGAKVKSKSTAGPRIDDPRRVLEWLGKERCAAKFHDLKEVQAKKAALQVIVRQWIAQM